MRESEWNKVLVPKRPDFWVEFLLMQAGGYLAGVLAILSCEHWGPWLTITAIVGVCAAMAALIWILNRRQT